MARPLTHLHKQTSHGQAEIRGWTTFTAKDPFSIVKCIYCLQRDEHSKQESEVKKNKKTSCGAELKKMVEKEGRLSNLNPLLCQQGNQPVNQPHI